MPIHKVCDNDFIAHLQAIRENTTANKIHPATLANNCFRLIDIQK